MQGFFNRVLRIKLTENNFRYEEIPDDVLKKTLGGKGLDEATDTLPQRFLTEPTREGVTLRAQDLKIMIEEYNEIRRQRDEKTPITP